MVVQANETLDVRFTNLLRAGTAFEINNAPTYNFGDSWNSTPGGPGSGVNIQGSVECLERLSIGRDTALSLIVSIT